MRSIGSSRVDPYSATAGAAAALYGPLHGGANEEVLKMLSRIENTRNIPEFIQRVKNGEGKLMGFGHRVRSEEHTSELQSRRDLVCRLLLEKKNKEKSK